MNSYLLATLTDPVISLFGGTYDVSLNLLGRIIRALIEGIGVLGVGIIVFSVLLKLVVLPFDIYQRVTMRKQNVKMKENKDKLEKLQKQYANDKQMYNQKMMEMYKENGISMFSSCLPAILSLVVFIVAINAFNAFSRFSNLRNYNSMVEAYNGHLRQYCASMDDPREEYLTVIREEDGTPVEIEVRQPEENKYIYYRVTYQALEGEELLQYIAGASKTYRVDVQKMYAEGADEEIRAGVKAEMDRLIEQSKDSEAPLTEETALPAACRSYLLSGAQSAVKTAYDGEISGRMKFLWIRNIWVTDSMMSHPVLDYSKFQRDCLTGKFQDGNGEKVDVSRIRAMTNAYEEDSYNIVTAKLSEEKGQSNGYFILIALSIGTILLQQFVSMRSQKEQTQYSSVDGQGGMNQKFMLVMMTVMFAIFSFMYSSAFAIYMVTSNIFSLLMTLIINKAVDVVMSKQEEKALQEQYNKRFRAREYRSGTDDKSGKNAKNKKR